MPKILIDPEAVFIDIPSTGGNRVLNLWDSYTDGYVPNLFTFSIVRHPIERLVESYSAYGRHISFEHFIDKAIYEKDFEAEWSISKHTLPMTSFDLDRCNFIARYERLDKDIEAIKAHLGLTKPFNSVTILKLSWKELFLNLDYEYQEKLLEYYKEDFKRFKYEVPNSLSGA